MRASTFLAGLVSFACSGAVVALDHQTEPPPPPDLSAAIAAIAMPAATHAAGAKDLSQPGDSDGAQGFPGFAEP